MTRPDRDVDVEQSRTAEIMEEATAADSDTEAKLNRLHGMAGIAATKVRAPVDIKATIRRLQRFNGNPTPGEQRHPCSIGAESGPTATTQRQYHGISRNETISLLRGKPESSGLVPAIPAMLVHCATHGASPRYT